MTKVTLARISATFYYVPLWIGMETGAFACRGIDLSVEQIGDGAVATRRLRDGSLDIALTPPDGVLSDAAEGGTLRVVAANANRLSHCLMALPKFRSFEDLRGARIGCISMTEGSTFHFIEIAGQNGLNYPGDYVFDPVGGAPTRHRMLLDGAIDAGLQSIPFTYIEEEAGLSNLATASQYIPDYQFNTINVAAGWAEGNRETLVAFLAALLEGTETFFADRNLAVAIAAREMKIEPRFAERAWDDFTQQSVIPRDMRPTLSGLAKVAELMHAADVLALSDVDMGGIVDLSYLDEATRQVEATPR